MPLDKDKILADLKAAAQPELEKRAEELRATFLTNVDEFVDSTKVGVLDDLLAKAAKYEIDAIMADDPDDARQYAEAAEDVLRQVSVVLVAEKVVAEKTIAAMIEAAALSVWEGFKSVATGLLSVAIKGVVSAVVPGGGAIADAVGGFLGDAIDGDGDGDDAA
jgi:hypothetical protein